MKVFSDDTLGQIHVTKRSGARRMTIRIKNDSIHVSIPTYTPYKAAIRFAHEKRSWIEQQIEHKTTQTITSGLLFLQKQIALQHESRKTVKVEETENEILIKLPHNMDEASSDSQELIKKHLRKLLMQKSKAQIAPAIEYMSDINSLPFSKVTFADLKSRWGSCNSKQEIKISIYLVQLPLDLQEYVLAHELSHTLHMNHSAEFKKQLEMIIPEYRALRKTIKSHTPELILL